MGESLNLLVHRGTERPHGYAPAERYSNATEAEIMAQPCVEALLADRDEMRRWADRAAADENANAADLARVTVERDKWRRYCEGARSSVSTLTEERDVYAVMLAEVQKERDEARAALATARIDGARGMRLAVLRCHRWSGVGVEAIRALDPATVGSGS